MQAFTQETGPTVQVGANPTELFLSMFTPELIDDIVQETNRYAALCLKAVHSGGGTVPTWETDGEELKAYFGFCVYMGMNRLPDLYDYWSLDEAFHYFPVASRITRKRFLEIQRYLHFANNETIIGRGEPGFDRLAKVRPVLESLRQSFLTKYRPHRENAIDEAMIKFKGRSALKQYLPKKPTKRGFKVWVRADSVNGYVCDLDVYTGKEESTELELGAKVVKKLSRPLAGGNYHLYYDNFFSSVKLCEDLLEEGLYTCGTFRRDRKNVPTEIKETKLGRYICIHFTKKVMLHQCACACTHTHTHTCTHARTCTYMYVHTRNHTYKHMYTHAHTKVTQVCACHTILVCVNMYMYVCVCTCICMSVYVCVHVTHTHHTHMHTCTYTHMHVHTHTHTHTHAGTHIHTHARMHTHTYTQECMHTHTHTHARTHTHTHTDACTHTHTHTYTHNHTCVRLLHSLITPRKGK